MTRTARGKEIDMASLVAANDDMVTVGNTSTNVRGDIEIGRASCRERV